MQAAVEIKGKQYIVQAGTRLRVDKIDSENAAVLKAEKVLMIDNDGKIELNPKKIEVSYVVLDQSQGKKIRVFKHHAKKRYRRTQGHRQDYTEIEIKTITEVK